MEQPEKIKQFIAQRAFDKWARENQTFIDDVQNLIHEMMMFEKKTMHITSMLANQNKSTKLLLKTDSRWLL